MPSRTDEMMSKGMGAVKSTKAMFKGLEGVFKTLMKQHGEVSAMLRRVKSDEDKRAELWPKIREELLSHEKGELREVYPVLREYDETRALADKHDREARELESQINRLNAVPINSEEWGRLFDQLVDTVKQHVDEEESVIFPKAQQVIGEERAKAIEPAFMSAKKSAMHTA